MPVLVDLINQVQKILPRRFGGTGNDKGYASERLLLDFMNDTGSSLAIGSLVKLVAAFSDRRVTLTTDANDRNVLGVVVGRRSTDAATLGQFEEVAPANYETVVVCVAGRCNVLITGSVTINQYAYPSSTDGTASASSTAVLGTIGRFDSTSSSSFASVILGRVAATTAPEFVSVYGTNRVTDMASIDFSSGFAVHSNSLASIAAIDLAYENFELDALQVKVANSSNYFTANLPATSTEILRPTSDIESSGSGTIVYSSGTTGWNLVDEAVVDTGDFYCGTNDAIHAWYIVNGFGATALTTAHRITSVRLIADTDLSLGGSGMWATMRDPQTGERYDVQSFNPGSNLDVTVTTRPWDGRPWTVDDLRHLQAGFRQGSGGNSGTVYQFYAIVNYSRPVTVEQALNQLGAGGGGGASNHNILSSTHSDSLAGTVVRGDMIRGNSTPAWSRVPIAGSVASNAVWKGDGTDAKWEWPSPVDRITSSASNTFWGQVDLRAGAGIGLSAASNTITISATGGGGGGTSIHSGLSGLSADDHSAYATVTAGGGETISTVASTGSTETADPATANVFDWTLTANCTITLTSPGAGVSCGITMILRQDGTGSRTVTWPGSVAWPGGTTPTLQTTASAVDVFTLFTIDAGTTWYGFQASGGSSGGSSGGGLLAYTSYDPSATDTSATGTTQADVDATNMIVTFTAPASGKVLVRLTCSGYGNGATGYLRWGLRESTTNIAGPVIAIDDANAWASITRAFVITGISAGSHTYKWAKSSSTASLGGSLRYGGTYGPAVMEVWEAP